MFIIFTKAVMTNALLTHNDITQSILHVYIDKIPIYNIVEIATVYVVNRLVGVTLKNECKVKHQLIIHSERYIC